MSTTITKKELIERVAKSTGQKRQDVKLTVQKFLEQVIIELGKGHRLEFRDFGVFEIKTRAARVAQNPKTMQRVNVPERRTVRFKTGRMLRRGLDDLEALLQDIATAIDTDEDDRPRRSRVSVSSNGRARHR